MQPQNATAVRQPANTPSAAPAAATAAAPNEPVTAESLGWQLRAALPPMRLHSVSVCDEEANVLWLSEGALGPDEHSLVVEAIDALGKDQSLNCYENGLEDGRVAIFLPVRAPQGSLVGLAMILADIKSVNDNVIERLLTPQVRTVMQKLAVLMRPPATNGRAAPAGTDAGLQILELAPDSGAGPAPTPAPAAKATGSKPGSAPTASKAAPTAAAAAVKAPAGAPVLSPQAVDDILEFELSPDVPAAAPVNRPGAVAAVAAPVTSAPVVSAPVAAAPTPAVPTSVSKAVPAAPSVPSGQSARNGAPRNGVDLSLELASEIAASANGNANSNSNAKKGAAGHAPAPASAIQVPTVAASSAAPLIEGLELPAAVIQAKPTGALPSNVTAFPTVSPVPTAASGAADDDDFAPPTPISSGMVPTPPTLSAAPPSVNGNGAHGVESVAGLNGAAANGVAVPTLNGMAVNGSANTAATTTSRTLTGSTKALAGAAGTNTNATTTSRVLQLPDGINLALDVQPFSKLRTGGRTRRFEVIARPSHPHRVPNGLDHIALQRLLTWMGANRAAWSLEPTSFTLNLSITTLEDERFPQFVASNLKQHGIAADNIGFEIAEPLCLQRRAQVERFITLCDKLGCFVVIDDFSLDSSIVSLLRSKALRVVKIDPKLTSVALKDKLAQAMVVAIAQAVKVLGIHCSAKRVESQASLQWLTAIGCDFAQGPALAQVQALESLGLQQPAAPATPPPGAA